MLILSAGSMLKRIKQLQAFYGNKQYINTSLIH